MTNSEHELEFTFANKTKAKVINELQKYWIHNIVLVITKLHLAGYDLFLLDA